MGGGVVRRRSPFDQSGRMVEAWYSTSIIGGKTVASTIALLSTVYFFGAMEPTANLPPPRRAVGTELDPIRGTTGR
jgi:hypothetical protein